MNEEMKQGWIRFGRGLLWTVLGVIVQSLITAIQGGTIALPAWAPVAVVLMALMGVAKMLRDKGDNPDSAVPSWVAKLPV